MIYSNLKQVWLDHQAKTGERLTVAKAEEKSGVSATTLNRLLNTKEPINSIAGTTLGRLCDFFGVEPGDILERRLFE